MTNEQEKQAPVKGEMLINRDTLPKLKPKQKKVLDAILSTSTQRQAAALAGVHESAISRYRADPLFAAHLKLAVAERSGLVDTQLQTEVLAIAQEAIVQILAHGKNEIARVTAAREVFEHYRYLAELANKTEQQALKLENLRLQNERLRLQNEVLENLGQSTTEDKLQQYFGVLRDALKEEKDG